MLVNQHNIASTNCQVFTELSDHYNSVFQLSTSTDLHSDWLNTGANTEFNNILKLLVVTNTTITISRC